MNVVSENVKTFWWCFNRPFDPLETHRGVDKKRPAMDVVRAAVCDNVVTDVLRLGCTTTTVEI